MINFIHGRSVNDSNLISKYLIQREWVFQKILHCINTRSCAKSCGLLILGGSGSGKSTICRLLTTELTIDCFKTQKLKSLLLASHFCSASDIDSLNLAKFIFEIHQTLLKSKYFGEIYSRNINSSGLCNLFLSQNLCNYPDRAFKNGILLPLLSFPPPNENMYILIDSIDENLLSDYLGEKLSYIFNKDTFHKNRQGSKNISDLLSAHHNFFPEWLSLVCTCRKENEFIVRKFMGFRKFYLDDLNKSYVIRDIQLYILNRIDKDDNLKQMINSETTELLNLLHIKSNGYIIYLEIVLDGILDGYLSIQVIKHIPGILCGLYLWIFETLFKHYQDFIVVKNIFNIMLSSLKSLSDQEIYCALLNLDINTDLYYLKDMLFKIKYFLVKTCDNCYHFRHNSLPEWLLDVKLCTPKYKCSLIDGHVNLALYNAYISSKLAPLQIRNFAFHLIASAPIFKFKGYHFAVWLLYSDCDIEVKGILPCEKFGSLNDWSIDDIVKILFESINLVNINKLNAKKSFTIFSTYILNITSTYSNSIEATNVYSFSLFESIRQNSYNTISQLIINGLDINCVNENGTSSLMVAAQNGFTSICNLLLSSGANQLMIDKDGWSALRLAIWNGYIEVVKLLLSQKIDPDFTGNDGRTALRTAAWIGRTDIVLLLLSSGSNINKQDAEGRTPLMAATYKCDYVMVKLLLNNGAYIDHQDNDGRSAIFVAALCLNSNSKYLDIIKLLLRYNCNINLIDNEGMNMLLIAAYEGSKLLCKILLENNADIDIVDRNFRSPLMAAAFSGNFEVVRLLLFWGAAIHCIDKSGFSVLSISANQGNSQILSELLARGLDEMHRDNFGCTPLHLASVEGQYECVNLLLKSGAKPNEIDNHGRIPLMLSCQEGYIKIAEKLIDVWPESVNFKSYDGSTSLKIAVLNRLPEFVEFLLSRGADATIQDNNGRTPLHISVLQSQYDCFQVLLQHSLTHNINNINCLDDDGRTAIHIASWKGDGEIIKSLIDVGARIDLKDNEGRTGLHLGAWQGCYQICQLLIDFGINIDETCSQGATALSIASQEGHLEICNLLINFGANVCHIDSCMRTPYKVAYKGNHIKICNLLEKHGALVDRKNV